MANNPTLDALTEIHKFNMAQGELGLRAIHSRILVRVWFQYVMGYGGVLSVHLFGDISFVLDSPTCAEILLFPSQRASFVFLRFLGGLLFFGGC